MINPLKKIGAGFRGHAAGQLLRKAIFLEKGIDLFADERFGVIRQGPIKHRGWAS
jgi:hypothetical protein